jgi:hypothetical protein
LQNGQLQNTKGVIPVTENVNWEMVYYEREEGKWVPLKDAKAPAVQYAGFGKPLTGQQMKNLLRVQIGQQ